MGQQRKWNTHKEIDTEPYEMEITQQYLDFIQEKKSRVEQETDPIDTEDPHEVIVYNQLPQSPPPISRPEKIQFFTPRFSFANKKWSKYYRITMAIWCTLTSFLFGKYVGFKLDNLKYLNVLTILLVNAYFIISIFLYIPSNRDKTSDNRLVRFLLHFYGLSFSLCLYVILCSWTEYPDIFKEFKDYNKFVMNLHTFYAIYMMI